jgi:hypothetical protein
LTGRTIAGLGRHGFADQVGQGSLMTFRDLTLGRFVVLDVARL